MATSKTLTPTNVTIQIPEFTDQPDQRVNSNCIDKEADAINSLNTAVGNKLDTANVYNGLDKSASGYALDARQGKALNDAITGALETVTGYTLNTNVINTGSVFVRKRGGLCFVHFYAVTFKQSGNNQQVITGLPKCLLQCSIKFDGLNAQKDGVIAEAGDNLFIGTDGTTLSSHLGSTYAEQHWATLVYPCG